MNCQPCVTEGLVSLIRCKDRFRNNCSLADVVVTHNSAFQKTLSGWGNSAVYCIPNFSTIGEPKYIPSLRERDRSLMIFGSSDRGRIYKNISQIKRVCQQLNIQTLFDIGRPIPWDSASLETEVNVIKTGFLNPLN